MVDTTVHWRNIQEQFRKLSQLIAPTNVPSTQILQEVGECCEQMIRDCQSLRSIISGAPPIYFTTPLRSNLRSSTGTIDAISPSTFSSGGTVFADVHSGLPPNSPIPSYQNQSTTSSVMGYSGIPPALNLQAPLFSAVDYYGTKKKKNCLICGEINTPEWRNGPKGKKTLCNACGLSYAKKEKQERGILSQLGHSKEQIDQIIDEIKDNLAMQVKLDRVELPGKKTH